MTFSARVQHQKANCAHSTICKIISVVSIGAAAAELVLCSEEEQRVGRVCEPHVLHGLCIGVNATHDLMRADFSGKVFTRTKIS